MPSSLAELLAAAAKRLAAAGIADARLEAELLFALALRRDRAGLYLRLERPAPPAAAARARRLVARRLAGWPYAYLAGRREFLSLELRVDPRALIPRPETEEVAEFAAQLAREAPPGRLADVGTGSGCLAAALAVLCPGRRILATDLCPRAAALARANLRRLGLAGRVTVRLGDLLAPLARARERFALIASNPPYVAQAEFARLPREIRLREPRRALVAGKRGTELQERLLAEAPPLLSPGGWLVLETAGGQWPALRRAAAQAGAWAEVRTARDLAGVARIFAARRG